MRPPELKTKVRENLQWTDSVRAEFPDSDMPELRDDLTMAIAPGEAPEIVHRLETWPDLVQACEGMRDVLRRIEEHSGLNEEDLDALDFGCDVLKFCVPRKPLTPEQRAELLEAIRRA